MFVFNIITRLFISFMLELDFIFNNDLLEFIVFKQTKK